jgi:hypothetical protein
LKTFNYTKHYTPPNAAEKAWSIFYSLRGAILTALAWTGTVDAATVFCLLMFEGTKDLYIQRYIQTLRNQFRGTHTNSTIRFVQYYFSRLATNIFFASITLLIAYRMEFFQWEKISHLVTSRMANSSHFFLGFVEAEVIAAGVLTREHISHLAGSFASLGCFAASLDLAGVEIFGIRPYWINLSTTICLLFYYAVRAIWKWRVTSKFRSAQHSTSDRLHFLGPDFA